MGDKPEHELGDDVEDQLAFIGGRLLRGQEHGAHAHQRHRGHTAPLSPNAVPQIANGNHPADDAHDLYVLWNLRHAHHVILNSQIQSRTCHVCSRLKDENLRARVRRECHDSLMFANWCL